MKMTRIGKRFTAVALGAVIVLSVLGCTCFAEAATVEEEKKTADGMEAAFQMALADAGLEERQVTDIEIDLERTIRSERYEIEFETRETRYEYIISEQGEILRKRATDYAEAFLALRKEVDNTGCIGVASALEIALADAGVEESSVQDLKVDLDPGLITLRYAVEFEKAGMEYEYQIDAQTGEIMRTILDD